MLASCNLHGVSVPQALHVRQQVADGHRHRVCFCLALFVQAQAVQERRALGILQLVPVSLRVSLYGHARRANGLQAR